MGYGSRALDLLLTYFQGQLGGGRLNYGEFGSEGIAQGNKKNNNNDDDDEENEQEFDESVSRLRQEKISQKKNLPPLLIPLSERPAERLDWIGVSFGLTSQLYNFWSRKEFKLCYLRQTVNDLTGEHSSIMLRELQNGDESYIISSNWLQEYAEDYRRRIINLLASSFNHLPSSLGLSLIVSTNDLRQMGSNTNNSNEIDTINENEERTETNETNETIATSTQLNHTAHQLTATELTTIHFTHHDIKRLELYSRNMVDYHMILDLVTTLCKLYYYKRFQSNVTLSPLQHVIFLSIGLQNQNIDKIAIDLKLPVNQILAFFNKIIKKLINNILEIIKSNISNNILTERKIIRMEKKGNQMIENNLSELGEITPNKIVSLKKEVTNQHNEKQQQKRKFHDHEKKKSKKSKKDS